MSREDDLREILEKTVVEFHQYDSNPSTWLSWLVYLLDHLERKSKEVDPMSQTYYVEMIAKLVDVLRNRLKTGGW